MTLQWPPCVLTLSLRRKEIRGIAHSRKNKVTGRVNMRCSKSQVKSKPEAQVSLTTGPNRFSSSMEQCAVRGRSHCDAIAKARKGSTKECRRDFLFFLFFLFSRCTSLLAHGKGKDKFKPSSCKQRNSGKETKILSEIGRICSHASFSL